VYFFFFFLCCSIFVKTMVSYFPHASHSLHLHLLVIQRSTLEWSTGGNTVYCQRHCSDTPKTQARKKLSPPQFSSRQICCRGLILLVHLANPLLLAHSFKPANPLQPMTPSSQQICHRQFIPLSPVSPTQAEHFFEPSHISFVASA
jgi:hypothetical protein